MPAQHPVRDKSVAGRTPNGRFIWYDTTTGTYEVQPKDDNYWIEGLASLEDALDAYEHPTDHEPAAFTRRQYRLGRRGHITG